MEKNPKQSPQELLKKPYARILMPEVDGTYSAEMLEFSGCYGEGDTAEEAIRDLEKAAASWIDAAREQGQEIPEPLATYEYSGKTNLRLPRSIHRQAARFAQRDSVSLNQFFASAIAERVGAEELYEHIASRIDDRLDRIDERFNQWKKITGFFFKIEGVYTTTPPATTDAIARFTWCAGNIRTYPATSSSCIQGQTPRIGFVDQTARSEKVKANG